MYTHKLNHIQVAVDIFVANNHGNQKYSESYQNDFDTWLKVLGIVSNEIYRYRPCLALGNNKGMILGPLSWGPSKKIV